MLLCCFKGLFAFAFLVLFGLWLVNAYRFVLFMFDYVVGFRCGGYLLNCAYWGMKLVVWIAVVTLGCYLLCGGFGWFGFVCFIL